jgi:hypothetical protein
MNSESKNLKKKIGFWIWVWISVWISWIFVFFFGFGFWISWIFGFFLGFLVSYPNPIQIPNFFGFELLVRI